MSNELVSVLGNLSMEQIAKGELPSQESADRVKTQLNLFVIAQAQRELKRIIRLTDTLDLIQDRWEISLQDFMDNANNPELVQTLPYVIDTLTKCLESANTIVSKVLGNEKIMNFQILSADNNSTINIGNAQNNQEILNLQDAASRKKVRDAVNAILSNINEEEKQLEQEVGDES